MNENKIKDRDGLRDYIDRGNQVKYLSFWGHQPRKDGTIGKSCLSQWFAAGFEIDGIYYPTAEHYMMAAKARLFQDIDAEQRILQAKHPRETQIIGREVRGFQEEVWIENRFEVVVRGNLAKFSQNEELKAFIANTNNRILVEASPNDRIWGIGLAANHPDAEKPDRWQGLNLLGFALMQVREEIAPIVKKCNK